MNIEIIQRVKEYISAHRSEIVRDIMRLARIPSVRSAAKPQAPFGENCVAALRESMLLFEENGFSVSIAPSNAYGIATYGEGEPTYGIFGHADVVPVGDDWFFTEPFEPVELDGYLIGRGVRDNKAGIVTALYVMRAFRDLALPLCGRLLAFIGTAEETGMPDVQEFVREYPMPVFSIVPDNHYPVSPGEKGICRLMARSTAPLRSVKGLHGGQAYNVTLDCATAELVSSPALKCELNRKIQGNRSFSIKEENDSLFLTAHGVPRHASRPDGSVNAAALIAECLSGVSVIDAHDREVFASLVEILTSLHGETLGVACNDPYFGLVTSANGIVRLDEGHLMFSLDIRYGAELDGDQMYATALQQLMQRGFEIVHCDEHTKPFRLSEQTPVFRKMMQVYSMLSGEIAPKPYYSGGGTYARHLRNAYSVGTAVPYICGEKTFPPEHGDSHQSDEAIYIDALLESVAMVTLMLFASTETISGENGKE